MDGKVLVFVEVKYRRGEGAGAPGSSVTLRKQRRISSCALYYMWRKGYDTSHRSRFDVISIEQKDILWIQDAFPYRAKGAGAAWSTLR